MKKSITIALRQVSAWRRDYKVWSAFAISLAFCIMYASRYISFSNALTYQVQAVEAYVIIGSSTYYFSGILLGALLLLSNAPFVTSRSTYEVLRVGRPAWLRGQLCYIGLALILYSLFTLLFCIAISAFSGDAYFENTWSEAITLLAKKEPSFAITEFKLSFPYGEFIDKLSPYGAMLITMFFNGCYMSLLCLCVFAVNVYSSRGFGWIAASVVHIAGYIVIANGIMMSHMFSLLACAFPAAQYVDGAGITPVYATVVFALLIGLLIVVSVRHSKRVTI